MFETTAPTGSGMEDLLSLRHREARQRRGDPVFCGRTGSLDLRSPAARYDRDDDFARRIAASKGAN